MSKVKIFLFLQYIFFSSLPVLAQVDTAWVRRYNGPGNGDDMATALAVDDSGNVYVTGNIATIKYLPNGDTAWVRISGVFSYALAVDDGGNVYVTGYSYDSLTYYDYATIKYNSIGDTLWVRRYNGPGNGYDQANALAVDDSGNVYVTGSSYGSGTYVDFASIKYAPNGDTLWVRRYNGPGNYDDVANALAVDDSGNLYVTGYSYGSGASVDYTTIKYTPNGETLWVRRYNGPENSGEFALALAVDDSEDVYVTGYGFGSGTYFDYVTIKYAPNGDTLWVRRYNGPGNHIDVAFALAVDGDGNVYVTGQSLGSGTYVDYATIKYAPNGDIAWVRRYNGPENSVDVAFALAVDGSENVYVTGFSYGREAFDDYATIKYAPNGETLAVRRFNGPGNGDDLAVDLAVDKTQNVYVTGRSYGGVGYGLDYATIKYAHLGCVVKSGDANNDFKINLGDIIFSANFLFKDGFPPSTFCAGDFDGDGVLTLLDIIYLVNYIFKGGPAPLKSKECCL